jgi:hypothetical protein
MPFTLLPTSAYATLDATKLTGNLPAISGANLTGVSGGKINQIVHEATNSNSSAVSVSSDTSVETLAITPSATNSKILVQIYIQPRISDGSDSNAKINMALKRTISGSTSTLESVTSFADYRVGNGQADALECALFYQYMDTSHNTTSAITYDVQLTNVLSSSASCRFAKMTAFEVLA